MMEGRRPRDIRERTFEFAVEVVRLCRLLDEQTGVSRTLGRQLLRSGTSIGANAEEAQAGQSRADFISKNAVALKEARETAYWLRLLAATDVVPASSLAAIQAELDEITRVLGAIIVSAKSSQQLPASNRERDLQR
jgi:four helix bundle protein